jgi:hypothetical protein
MRGMQLLTLLEEQVRRVEAHGCQVSMSYVAIKRYLISKFEEVLIHFYDFKKKKFLLKVFFYFVFICNKNYNELKLHCL